jgi:hypothetical protein
MLHDLYGLGDIGKYQGLFAVTQDYATGAVQQVGFPMERLHVCPGWIQEATLSDRSPDLISCCYLDMDFYESTKDVLKLLVDRMPSGGIAILDDYNFFTKGPRTAVVEIMEEHPGAFSLQNPYDEKFAILSHL